MILYIHFDTTFQTIAFFERLVAVVYLRRSPQITQ